jgi:hypothetical protein
MTRVRSQAVFYKSTTEELIRLLDFDHVSELTSIQDLQLEVAGSGTYTVSGINPIKFVLIEIEDGSVNVSIGGGTAFLVKHSLLLDESSFASLSMTNPSSSIVAKLRLVVGG